MLAKIQLLLVFNPILAAGLAQALGIAAGIIQGIGLVPVSGGLIGAAVGAIRPESPNLARGQGAAMSPRQNQKEKRPSVRAPASGYNPVNLRGLSVSA